MDTLTHALSGALLARATEPRSPRPDQLPRRLRMAIGFWAAAFPDADFIASVIDPLTYLSTHRGITHSVLLLPLWAIGLAVLFALILRRRYPWQACVGICALGIGAHIAGDIITAFGTMIFAPFSNWRAQGSTTFIIDLYFTGIIVIGLIASMIWQYSRLPALVSLIVLAGFVGFEGIQHQRAVAIGESYIATRGLKNAESHAIPQPLSPFNWMVVVQEPRTYHLTFISLTRDEVPPAIPESASWLSRINASYLPVREARWQLVARFGDADPALAELAWRTNGLARYRDFAMFPAVFRLDRNGARTCVWFDDLRFKLIGRNGPFRYGTCDDGPASAWKIYRLNDTNDTEHVELIPDS